jgi:hypothetical protein
MDFSAYWFKHRERGEASPLEDYSVQAAAAHLGKLMRPINITAASFALCSSFGRSAADSMKS